MGLEPSIIHAIEAAGEDAPAILRAALGAMPRGRIGLVSSFGTESAVLLAMAAEVDPSVPVLFLETGQHFPETLAYRDQLIARLGLTGVRNIHPDPAQIEARDPQGQLWAFDPDACCALRKVEPLDEAIIPFDAWITGRKRSQAATRAHLPVIEPQADGRFKINPLARWNAAELDAEMTRRALPRHPLSHLGYRSIGCAPCTRPVAEGEDPRAGRWAGLAKTECGIHV
ncbi:phosphoadenylyl-sulfate reductase [Gluconacetobacter sp. Hr-1-5]|uniref:phosphoadenylyl-sulfate reductase n=1 Tax=Gluconacetobacter sp. Hr-1-5 TaxID=3395370 RepID=UPI003B52D87D